MALQTSGPISLANVQGEFGGSNPISLSEYYSAASGVPASGVISLGDFYGKSMIVAPIAGSTNTLASREFPGLMRRDSTGTFSFGTYSGPSGTITVNISNDLTWFVPRRGWFATTLKVFRNGGQVASLLAPGATVTFSSTNIAVNNGDVFTYSITVSTGWHVLASPNDQGSYIRLQTGNVAGAIT